MKNANDTLLILSPGFPKDEMDSTCLPAQQALVRSLNKNFPNLRIIILALEYPFTELSYHWNRNLVIPFNGWKKGRIHKLRIWVKVWKRLIRLKNENHIIGILSLWVSESAMIGKYFAKYNHIKQYSWILGQDAKPGNRFMRWMKPRSDELIAMSHFLAKEFNQNYSVLPKYIIPNGIDTSAFDGSQYERDIDVLGVGSLIPLKQYDVFIEIIHELKRRLLPVHAIICGKGKEKESLQSMIQNLKLEDNILLLGEKPHPEILQLMQRAKVFLHTSSYEGFSTVCLEALYSGAHVISFCNPMMEWVRHWHIVSGKEEMLELLEEILEDKNLDHRPILPYNIDDISISLMKLFDQRDAAIS